MCLITLVIWLVLGGIVIGMNKAGVGDDATVIAGLVAIGLGIIMPVALNFWRPVFFGWVGRRKKVQTKLLSEGVLTNEDLEKGARMVHMSEVRPGTERKIKDTSQHAFVVLDSKVCRVLGEKLCFSTETFKIVPGCTGRCSKCWVIWACGGDSFRLRANVSGTDREFLIQCREGRTLRQIARATEMLEEIVEMDAAEAEANKNDEAQKDENSNKTSENKTSPTDINNTGSGEKTEEKSDGDNA